MKPACRPSPSRSAPGHTLPAGACDAHCHVFGAAAVLPDRDDTDCQNAVSYTTQNYAGLTGTAIYGFSTTTGYQATDNLGVDLSYLNGPFTAVFSAQRVRTAAVAPSTQQEMYLIDGAYDANLAKFCAAA